MLSLHKLDVLGAAGLVALALSLASAAPPGGPLGGPPGPQGSPPPQVLDSGDLLGTFDLPIPGNPGELHGRFLGNQGEDRYRVDAKVLRFKKKPGANESGPKPWMKGGPILGQVRRAGDDPEVVGNVIGQWRATDVGVGVYRFAVVVDDPASDGGKRVIGFARGTYLDPTPGPGPAGGAFQGNWVLFGNLTPDAER